MAEHVTSEPVDRRQLLISGLLMTAAIAAPAVVWRRMRHGETGEATPAQRQILAIVCDLVIPPTDTPGASAVGVPEFVELALNHGLDGSRTFGGAEAIPGAATRPPKPEGGLYLLDFLTYELNARSGGDFLKATPDRQHRALEIIDLAAFAAPRGQEPPWRKLKNLILTGYYTSEAGASRELRYELVPGRWDPNLALAPDQRAFSSDWTAVDFG